MSLCLHRYLMAGLIALSLAAVTTAQEAPPEDAAAGGEQAYFDLRHSKDRSTQLFAERYLNLVRVQEWSSKTGKSKVMAKYVAHDPNLKWVKLATAKGTGKDRVFKEVTVDVAQLSPACQKRVKQIAALQSKLDELAAAEKETEASGAMEAGGEYGGRRSRQAGGERGGYSGYNSEAVEAAGREPAPPNAYERGEAPRGPAETGAPSGADDPDPLGFAELANEPPLEMPAGPGGPSAAGESPAPGYAGYPPRDAEPAAGPVNGSQWATDFVAFRSNFSTGTDERGSPAVNWGELGELRAMNEAATENVRDSAADPYRQKISEIAERLGEVRWQATLAGVDMQERGGPEVHFALPPLPEPLKIRFFGDLNDEQTWSQMRPGQRVQFVGKFDIRTPNEIDVHIHLAN